MMQLGEFTLDEKQARLFWQDKEVAIEPKLFELLLLFVNRPNTIISRQDILDHLWENSLVTDNAINKLVANLRKVLIDEPKNPRYIQTVPKRGYRMICEVAPAESVNASDKPQLKSGGNSDTNSDNKHAEHKRYRKTITALLLLFSCLFLWKIFSSNDENRNNNRYTMALTREHGAEESARMHPDNNQLYYLKKDAKKARYQLWVKDIHTKKLKQVDSRKANISEIIAVVSEQNSETTNLFYLDKKQDSCGVYQATIIQDNHTKHVSQIDKTLQWKPVEMLFDCRDKRIKDIDYHVSRNMIYYTAQPQNFWPNQIYSFNLTTKKHSFVTQVEPVGWGHHSIDISPDGEKLLIMSTNNDYKTQLLALNFVTNEITEGFKFDYPVLEAIWHHDSEQVYYYAAPPVHQIIKSDLNGNNATTVVNISENLSTKMSLFPDGKNLLFSTEHKNLSNRWFDPSTLVNNIDNSTVDDTAPALFHHSSQYLFVSKRSGRRQLYLGRYDVMQAEIVTNFTQSHWLGYTAVSTDDESVLINVDNEVYLLPMSTLNETSPLTTLKKEQLIFTSGHPIISLDWLTTSAVAITTVINGIPELMVVNLLDYKVQQLNDKWAYGLTDSQHPEHYYLIEQQSNTLYRSDSSIFSDEFLTNQQNFTNTQVTLPNDFYHVKIEANVLYYGSNEGDNDYLNAVPLNNIDKASKYLLNDFNSYDVSNGKIMLSDIESLEGDVHRTVN